MGLRFRKRFKLAPGLRLNMSGSGFSWTVGPRGASINLGQRSIRRNLDLPGGFSFQSQSNRSPRQTGSQATSDDSLMDAHIAVSEDGTLRFSDAEGTPLASHVEARVKDQQGAAIKELLVNKNSLRRWRVWNRSTLAPHLHMTIRGTCRNLS